MRFAIVFAVFGGIGIGLGLGIVIASGLLPTEKYKTPLIFKLADESDEFIRSTDSAPLPELHGLEGPLFNPNLPKS